MTWESQNLSALSQEQGHGSAYTTPKMWMATPSRFLEKLRPSASHWVKLSLPPRQDREADDHGVLREIAL
eukprot:9028002-Alexandrium_andersonii.AAC.1